MGSTESDLECSISFWRINCPRKRQPLKPKCTELLAQPPLDEKKSTKMPHSDLFLEEKLSSLSKHNRMVAKKG